MANKSQTTKAIGIVLIVAGIGLGVWGYQMSGSLVSEISQTVTGSFTDAVMVRYIGGAAAFLVGLYLYLKG